MSPWSHAMRYTLGTRPARGHADGRGGRPSSAGSSIRSATPTSGSIPGPGWCRGVLVYLDNRLFFANAGYVRGRIRGGHRRCPNPRALAGVRRRGAHPCGRHRGRRADRADPVAPAGGITFVFARLKGPMRQALGDAGILGAVGDHLYPTVRSAAPSEG